MANKIQKVGIRKNKIMVYLTDDEKEQAENYANSERLKISALLRKMILDAADEKEKTK
jgi:hypothetical protein